MKLKHALGFFLLFAFTLFTFSCNHKEEKLQTKHSTSFEKNTDSSSSFKITPVDYGTMGYDYSAVIKENPVIHNGFDVVSIDPIVFHTEITARSNSPPQGINI